MPRLMRLITAVALIVSGLLAWPASAQGVLKMSTTTSTENSGLLGYLLPAFEASSGIKVQVISVGTGKALELAKNGDVDVTLVHARPSEDKFVAEGHGVNRRDVMYNDFIIVGPDSDPAGIRGGRDVLAALRKIADSKARFISRGDNSGTDQMEKSYWKSMGIAPTGKQVTMPLILIYRIADDKIVEHWMQADALGMLQQLGVIPPMGQAS